MKTDQVNVAAFAVLGDFEEIEDAGEAGFAGKLWCDVGEADLGDGVDLDVAVTHFVAIAGDDVRAGPDADGAGDLSADDSLAKAFGEDHKCRLQITDDSGALELAVVALLTLELRWPSRILEVNSAEPSYCDFEFESMICGGFWMRSVLLIMCLVACSSVCANAETTPQSRCGPGCAQQTPQECVAQAVKRETP